MTLERIEHKVFASEAPLEEMGQFGSALATTKLNTKDVAEIQALPAYTKGWGSAIISENNYPAMEEMNGVLNVMSYHTGYLYQEGIPVYSSTQTYSATSWVKDLAGNKMYKSLKDNNTGNALSNTEWWTEFGYVSKAGDTMTGNLAFDFDQNVYRGIDSTLKGYEIGVKPSTEQRGLRVISYDKNGEYVTASQARCKADGWNCYNILAKNFVGGVQNIANFNVQASDTGDSGLWFNSLRMRYVDYYVVGNGSWYRRWSDGWLEQGGCIEMNNGQTITLLKPFKAPYYTLTGNVMEDEGIIVAFKAHTVDSFTVRLQIHTGSNTSGRFVSWYACGQGAE